MEDCRHILRLVNRSVMTHTPSARASLNEISAGELSALLGSGEVTCEQVARACIDRVTTQEHRVRAWAHFHPDAILARARRLDRDAVRGPLHGIPVGVKDVIDTFDMPTEMGSPIYRGHRPLVDASCVALLRAAGALIFGKTETCEFAGAAPAPTTNPHDAARTPGGSSSGSAAAVADFQVPLALGTQTGGSVLRPASFCGIVGFKPTFGLINIAGVKPAATTLDTVGLLARTVEDVELAIRVLTNASEVEWLPLRAALRIGVCRTPLWETAEDCTKRALADAAERLARHGHATQDVTLPAHFAELSMTREIINDYERARASAHEWHLKRDQISGRLSASIRAGFGISRERYVDALRLVERCRAALPALFEEVDVLLAPTVIGEAPVGLACTGDHGFQSLWTQLRVPAVTLPTHAGPNGMPVGIQLVGRPYEDSRLLAAARRVFELIGTSPIEAANRERAAPADPLRAPAARTDA